VTATLLAASDDLVDALRGRAVVRPTADRGIAGGLRAWLDDGIFERLGVPATGSIRVTANDVAGAPPDAGPLPLLRGALVAQLVRLRAGGVAWSSGFESARLALVASGRDDLCARLDSLDDDELARLAADVDAHAVVLAARLPVPPPRWSPRCGVRQRVRVGGGAVELRGTVDLVLGNPGGPTTCVCLLDVTTSPLSDRHERMLGFLALLETLRCGEPPLRVAVLSTADGTAALRDVDAAMLADAVGAVLEALGGRPGVTT
jgi:hypothetical protein